MTKLEQMLLLVIDAHAGQVDQVGQAYVLHTISVMNRLETIDSELQMIALGHDLLEDTSVSFAYLYHEFGSRVANAIQVLTHDINQTRQEYKDLILKSSMDVLYVKRADIEDNMNLNRLTNAGYMITDRDRARNRRYSSFLNDINTELLNRLTHKEV